MVWIVLLLSIRKCDVSKKTADLNFSSDAATASKTVPCSSFLFVPVIIFHSICFRIPTRFGKKRFSIKSNKIPFPSILNISLCLEILHRSNTARTLVRLTAMVSSPCDLVIVCLSPTIDLLPSSRWHFKNPSIQKMERPWSINKTNYIFLVVGCS